MVGHILWWGVGGDLLLQWCLPRQWGGISPKDGGDPPSLFVLVFPKPSVFMFQYVTICFPPSFSLCSSDPTPHKYFQLYSAAVQTPHSVISVCRKISPNPMKRLSLMFNVLESDYVSKHWKQGQYGKYKIQIKEKLCSTLIILFTQLQ